MTPATDMGLSTYALLHQTFPEMSDAEIDMLANAARQRHYPADSTILREGEKGNTLYLIDAGEVDILVHAQGGDILIDTIGAGTYFGEMAFLGETTRMATIRTRTPCDLLELDEADFMPIAQSNPELLHKLLRQIIGHLRRNDQAVIHELNLKNAALQQAYSDLEEQEGLRTQFIATLSHELRTPLTSIQGYLGLINGRALTGPSLDAAMGSLTRNVAKMVGLTNDLLILYEMHPSQLEFVPLNVADVLIEAINAAKTGLDGVNTAVTLDIAPSLPTLRADKRGLTLALRAILENAFKFDPDHQPVAIRSFATTLDGTPDGTPAIAISISDSGVGMPAADADRIFDPFVRLEREGSHHLFPGLGVGLTIARFMVEKHNGRITVTTAPGQGSTFTVFLPGE